MAVRTISTKLAIDGEAQYRQAISACNAELKTMRSSLALVESEFRNNANSTEALTAKGKALAEMQEAQSVKITKLENALANAQRHQEAYATAASEAAAKVEEYNAQLEELKNSTGDTQEEQAALTAEIEKWKAAQEEAEAANLAASRGVQSWQQQLNRARIEENDLTDAINQNNQYLREAEESADGCASSIDEYGRAVRDAGDASDEFGESGGSAVDALAQAIAAAGLAEKVKEIAATLYDCVETFGAFQSQMSSVQAISGATAEEMSALAEKAKYMGSTTSFTSMEAGQAMEYMAMAGWKTGDMLDALEGIMHLAAASGEDLASTSDIVTDALTAFGLKASDSGHFADVLAKASANANTNVSMMGETFQYAAPVAGALGYSIEDTALAIGLMANAGIKGSQAGTALRGVLTNLAKPSDTVAAYMEELGVSLTDDAGRVLSLSELMAQLRDRFADLTEAQQAEYAAGLAGKNAMSGLLAVVNASEEDYRKLEAAISDCNNAASEMSQTRLDNYAGQITLLDSAIDGLKLTVGEQLEPVLSGIAGGATDAVAGLTELLDVCPALVPVLSGLVTAAGALATAFAGFSMLKAVKPLLLAFNAALAESPAGAVAVAMVGVVTALTVLSAQCENAGAEAKEFTRSLKESQQAYEELEASMTAERASIAASIKALEGLMAVEHKSAAQKDVIRQKVEELNQAVPGLELAYDEAADAINMTADALERMAESTGNQEEYAAQVERLNELYTEQSGLEEQLAQNQERLAEARDSAQWDSFGGAMNDSATAVGQLQQAEYELNLAMEENAQRIAELEESTQALSDRQETAAAQAQETALQTEAVTVRVESAIDAIDSLGGAYEESYASALESVCGQVKLFEEMDGAAKTSINSLIDTLKGQVDYMETYAANIQKAMELGVDQGLVQQLSDGSEKSAQILAAIVEGGKEDIAALNDQFSKVEEGKQVFAKSVAEMETDFKKKMEDLVDDMDKAIQDMDLKDDAYKIGKNNLQGLIDGTASQKQALVNKYAEMGRAALEAYKREVQQASPSKAFYRAGSYDIQGIINGAESEKAKLDAAYAEMAQTALASMERGLPSSFVEPRTSAQSDQTAALLAAIKSAGTCSGAGGQALPFSLADLTAAFREAMEGLSVNMNQRKVGEMISDWQKNNGRSRGV